MALINWLSQYELIINQIWLFTISAMFVLYIVCNVLPDRIVGQYLPLHNVFKLQTNIDLDYQSIGYVMLHTSLFTKITHSTIIIESLLWFVIFDSWHWTLPYFIIFVIVIQSFFIGDKKFGIFFILVGIATLFGARFTSQFLGNQNALLLAKAILMMGGLMRMLSHSAELIPPLLINQTDQFVKLTAKNLNWKVLLSSPIGYVAEFGSSLPNRLLPVQVNYIYQTIFKAKPQSISSWNTIEKSASEALSGGYSKLNSLKAYYQSVVKGE
jgi:hypothetical protein